MSFFGVNVNPFSTPIGHRIEQATDGNLASENWTLNMEICDLINESEDGPRDAIKAIKRRLNQSAGKNYTIVMYTLTVLETCVKNCGKRFHTLACSREFIQELVKLIGPKNEPPTVVQEKVLSLIQTWAETFRDQPHAQGVVQIHQELKSKGMQFPVTDLENMAPIITPERSVPEAESNAVLTSSQGAAAVQTVQPRPPNQPIKLTEEQLAKLQSELDVVQGNMRVLTEMLNYMTAADNQMDHEPNPDDIELLTELHSTCKAMQERIVELIGKLDNDDLTAELLRLNDELNNLFLRYSRFKKNKNVTASSILAQTIGGQSSSVEGVASQSKRQDPDSLIDLSDTTEDIAQNLATTSLTGKDEAKKRKDKDEFDMFAQSRTGSSENSKPITSGEKKDGNPTSSKASTDRVSSTSSFTTDFDNEEDLFHFKPSGQPDQSLTSSEFERFLAERSATTESTQKPTTGTTSSTTTTTNSAVKKDQDEKSLLAL